MYAQIKALADEALKLELPDSAMDLLNEIVLMCDQGTSTPPTELQQRLDADVRIAMANASACLAEKSALAAVDVLAKEALALQNKNRMDAALREISALCDSANASLAFGDSIASTMLPQLESENARLSEMVVGETIEKGSPVVLVDGKVVNAPKATKKGGAQ